MMMPMLRSRAERQQLVERDLVEQRVAAGQQEAVEVGLAGEAGQHLGLVHAGADRPDDALRAQLGERLVGAVERLSKWSSGSWM